MHLDGLHHITAITGDARGNVDFYTRVLGLRMIAKTVNQDDPSVYHLFYGDELAHPGLDLTFFEYPNAKPARAGAWGPARRWTSGPSGSRARGSPPSARATRWRLPIPRGSGTS